MPSRSQAAFEPGAFTQFGDLLRFLRRRARLTQRELSMAVGYNFAQISRLEQGQRLPNPSTLQALFVPALGLEDEPELAARLLELAQAAHDQRAAGTLPPSTAVAASATEQELQATSSESDARDPPSSALGTSRSAHILVTKLYVPRPRFNRVARSRLLARLDGALHVPLTLVSAPAGFGKTTLLADWLAARSERSAEVRVPSAEEQSSPSSQRSATRRVPGTQYTHVAWLALDEGDNDPTTFLRYLIAAVQTLAPTAGGTALILLHASQPPVPETVLRMLLNDLAALPEESVLVLDDYHLITVPAIHTAMAVLLEHLPPALHLVLAMRADPPLPVARLRAHGQLVELRAADLRFTLDEAASFLTEVMGLPLAAADIAALETRTEGWIAGLQLAALAMRDRSDLPGFINAFTGSNRFVVEYLAEEVFERQPRHLQSFLLQTSILDRLCGPLCDAVMGLEYQVKRVQARPYASAVLHPHAAYTQTLLEELERANLFFVPLDDERRWYRYHHLFGELLRERLLSGAPAAEVARLHGRARAWFAEQGLIEEAIQHALAADEPTLAAHLIEEHAEAMTVGSQITTLQRWIGLLPEELVTGRHRLALTAAGVQMTVGDIAAVEPLLQAAERAQRAGGSTMRLATASPAAKPADAGWLDDVDAVAGSLRSIVARAQNDLPRAIVLAQAVLDRLPSQFHFLRASVTWNLGMTHWISGDLASAADVFAADWADNRSLDNIHGRIIAASSLGRIRVIQGRLREAAQIYRESLQQSGAARMQVPSVGMIYVGLGDVLREWNDLDGALGQITVGIELGKQFGNADLLTSGYTTLARVQHARGDYPAAAAAFAQAQQFTPNAVFSPAAQHHARLWLAHGDVAAAERWARRAGLRAGDDTRYEHEDEHIVLARVLIARHELMAARTLLERLVAAAEAGGRTGKVIETLILQARVLDALGDRAVALTALEHALVLAEPEAYVRLFADEGAPLANLLSAVNHQPSSARHRHYIAQLLAACG